MADLLDIGIDATGALRGANQFAQATEKISNHAARAEGSVKKLGDKMKALGSQLAGVGATLSASATAPLALLGTRAVSAAKDMDSLTRGLTAVMNSSSAAGEELKKLREVAKLPGLGFKEAIQGSINLQAAGFSAELARRSLGAFGNALATVGKGKAELDGVGLALSQIASKGKVSAEEINQLAERVPQIRKVMQAAFGTAETEALQKRGIGATEFVEKVVAELEKLPRVTGGAANSFENLSDTIEQALLPLGNAILRFVLPAIDAIVPVIERASAAFANLSTPAQNTILAIAGIAAVAGPLVIALGGIVAAVSAIGAPLVIGIAAVSAAVAGLAAAWINNFGGIRETTMKVVGDLTTWWRQNLPIFAEAAKNVLATVKDLWAKYGADVLAIVKPAWERIVTLTKAFVSVFGNTLKLIAQLINGDQRGAWETFVKIVKTAGDAAISAAKSFGQQIWATMKLAAKLMIDSLLGLDRKFHEIGNQIIAGLINGVKEKTGAIGGVIAAAALTAVNVAKATLGVRSPSVEFFKIGEFTVDGFILGIKSKGAEVKKALSEMMKDAISTAREIASFSDPRVFAARNNQADLQDRLTQTQGIFDDLRAVRRLPNVPQLPQPSAIPSSEAGAKALRDQLDALKGLNDAIDKINTGKIPFYLGVPEGVLQAPEHIRKIAEEMDRQERGGEAFRKYSEAIQGVIEKTEELTVTQRIQRDIEADASLNAQAKALLMIELIKAQNAETKALLRTKLEEAQAAENARLQSQLDQAQDRIRDFGRAAKGILRDAFYDGIVEGPRAFFQTLLGGFAQLLAQMAAQLLASQVFKLLGGLMGGSSGNSIGGGASGGGGGFLSIFSKILGIAGTFAGSVGGGTFNAAGTGSAGGVGYGGLGAALGGLASGGMVSQSGMYNVGELGAERVFLPRGSYVQNNYEMRQASQSATPPPVNITVIAKDANSFNSPQTRDQIARDYSLAMARSNRNGGHSLS